MHRRVACLCLAVLLVAGLAACGGKKVQNPIAAVDSKQPDKVLFDRAMDSMQHKKYDTARITLQTMLQTYPDSEYAARAKLAIGDSWAAEGGTAADTQAESEYKDFITFFPNLPEAAEAQMKIANLHFQQMEKPDRDFTHAKQAEQEYRKLISDFPDSKLVPQAKEQLRQVQEVLAEREFRIGRFYYLRESWPAAIARLKSVADAYPLYSSADESLMMLGDAYEQQAHFVQSNKGDATAKARLIKDDQDKAAEAYARIMTRYPVSEQAKDAKKRLEALHRPVPTPTPQAIAVNKAEEESRGRTGRIGRTWFNFRKAPDTALAAKVGEPSLVDPQPTNATDIVKNSVRVVEGKAGGGGSGTVSVETVKSTPPANGEVPRSDNGAASPANANGVAELKPMSTDGAPAPAPPQVNEAAQGGGGGGDASPEVKSNDNASAGDNGSADDSQVSSSKTKKKKGLRRVLPF